MILQRLKAGHSISPLVALRDFSCMRLAARVAELRDKGYRIETERHPRGYAVYRLDKENPPFNGRA